MQKDLQNSCSIEALNTCQGLHLPRQCFKLEIRGNMYLYCDTVYKTYRSARHNGLLYHQQSRGLFLIDIKHSRITDTIMIPLKSELYIKEPKWIEHIKIRDKYFSRII